MPRAYNQDLRWRAIWLTEVSFYLQLSKKTISRYTHKFRMLGSVDTAVIGIGHIIYTCISMHPHGELVVMELLLQHPEKNITEMLDEVHEETGACSMLHCY